MAWLEVSADIPAHMADQCSDILESIGAVSVSFFDGGDVALLEPKPGTTPLWELVKIVGLFPDTFEATVLKEKLRFKLPKLTFEAMPLPEQEWSRTWLEHFKPMKFGQKLWISPCDLAAQIIQPEAVIIQLDPGLAFGTGTHPTTALCLQWLDGYSIENQQVIDYGCGSGILGIAALMLGAKKVWAVDYDPQALIATQENAERNQLTVDRIVTLLPNELRNTVIAELVLANILAEPLIQLAPLLRQHCAIGGYLVLSGLLVDQSAAVQKAYADWFRFEEICQEGWVLLAGKRIS